jgi:hypothetical protein
MEKWEEIPVGEKEEPHSLSVSNFLHNGLFKAKFKNYCLDLKTIRVQYMTVSGGESVGCWYLNPK